MIATPSYALRIAEVAEQIGIHPERDLSMRTALVGSELMTEAMRQEMYKAWGEHMNVTQNYGMSELMGPGVSGVVSAEYGILSGRDCKMHVSAIHNRFLFRQNR